jgi:hypothetical protein
MLGMHACCAGAGGVCGPTPVDGVRPRGPTCMGSQPTCLPGATAAPCSPAHAPVPSTCRRTECGAVTRSPPQWARARDAPGAWRCSRSGRWWCRRTGWTTARTRAPPGPGTRAAPWACTPPAGDACAHANKQARAQRKPQRLSRSPPPVRPGWWWWWGGGRVHCARTPVRQVELSEPACHVYRPTPPPHRHTRCRAARPHHSATQLGLPTCAVDLPSNGMRGRDA